MNVDRSKEYFEKQQKYLLAYVDGFEQELPDLRQSDLQKDANFMEDSKKVLEYCKSIRAKSGNEMWISDYSDMFQLIRNNECLQSLFIKISKNAMEFYPSQFIPPIQRFGKKENWTLREIKLRNPDFFTPDAIEAYGTTDIRLFKGDKTGRQYIVLKNHGRWDSDGKVHCRYSLYTINEDGSMRSTCNFYRMKELNIFLHKG